MRSSAQALVWMAVATSITVALAATDRMSAAFQTPTPTPVRTTSPTPTPRAGQTNEMGKTIADFQDRVKNYLAAQRKLSADIPRLPEKATPAQIDARQRELGKLVMAARKGVRRGELFGPEMTVLVRRLLAPVFKGPEGAKVRASIFDEPHPVVPEVNVRYPDDVPLSTMPPDIMRLLPSLDPALEYRFIGRHLILLDVDAHLIIDVIDNAIPA